MGQEPILSQMILPIIKVILALLRLVSKVELRQLPERTKPKHSKSTRQASDSTAATFDGAFEKLTMDILHVLQQSDQLMLNSRAGDYPRLSQHIAITTRFELHLVHEILNAMGVEDAIAVDEQHEQIIVPAKVVLIDAIDQFERFLLAASLPAVRESGHRDSTPAIGYVDADREGFQGNWHA